ncbi:type II toxin-antitoxin system RelE/ParE family toxin [Salmonella enterica]|nr:type II toxin-antitoxin system RelE/ParE family toxin [Salmonella enterica]EGM2645802.1 type II toxin-antitoxin system RelE/ParE family toxin [Salmonella enterica]EGM2983888.1 type II toxin-antitoxin system RelE/ParE family toxin [Salmonella enterica]EHG0769527.1 type II toxin-antitoxin system RelE/ParE family toxin [Salmonella enterica]EJU6033175.1 type II toxin-antitoxin system RelE/ParE family toxin [Salmonella enterica]
MAVVILYTNTVKVCIEDIASHLRRIEVEPKEVINAVIGHFESRVSQFPLGCQICPELLKIGCAKYRECNTPDGYRVLYSVDDNEITAHAILAYKQDIQQLLFKRLISI